MIDNSNRLHCYLSGLRGVNKGDLCLSEATLPAVRQIEAVIMFCDLRQFTDLSNRLSQEKLIELLCGYFRLVVPVIEAFGGEVVQLIGDGILAVFRFAERGGNSCKNAIEAALLIQHRLHLEPVAGRILQAGIALHAGEVSYGAIGAGRSCTLTVIGPAVNLTSRLEKLCHLTKQPILVSKVFARRLGLGNTRFIGRFRVKGFDEPQDVYAPKADD
ncbi:adenylate/guanylate cyclase domain-containing protein [Dongia soli]|uniref:Adenylate/guanylate cyclase domain-containing protein n=1 Tax=Dongia soli TaxID=600628 RepID=A0ABU5ECL2_9PROT|nr:adenylate/guanylate cyclase domain-containing protein [Dongia soli]MDY0883539.1 adenylate/guanylate cyclase domain-containing protein [Dongia soli]